MNIREDELKNQIGKVLTERNFTFEKKDDGFFVILENSPIKYDLTYTDKGWFGILDQSGLPGSAKWIDSAFDALIDYIDILNFQIALENPESHKFLCNFKENIVEFRKLAKKYDEKIESSFLKSNIITFIMKPAEDDIQFQVVFVISIQSWEIHVSSGCTVDGIIRDYIADFYDQLDALVSQVNLNNSLLDWNN